MAWIVPLVPFFGALALALVGRPRGGSEPPRALLATLGTATMIATAALAALAGSRGWIGALAWAGGLGPTLDYGFATAPIAPIFSVLVPVIAAPVVAYAAHHEDARGLGRLLALLAFSVAAMELLAGAADLLVLLMGWEAIGALSAVLVAHGWWERGKAKAGVVVFLTTRTGDLGMFLTLLAAFAGTGTLRYDALADLAGVPLQLVAGGLLAAAAAKSAQLPFAPWLFAAMEGPVTVSALLHAATMVAAGAFLLIRLEPVFESVAWFGPAAMGVGLATALAGGLVGVLQPNAKRLLAGSTSVNYGLMFVAAGAGYPAIATLHLVAHAFAKAPLFLAAGIGHACTGSYRLSRMKLGRALPTVAVASAFPAAAIAGVPPLGAAWTKDEIVTAAGHAAPWLAGAVAVAGALSAAYMARFWFQAFGRGRRSCAGPGSEAGGRGPGAAGERRRGPGATERWALYFLVGITALLSLLWAGAVQDPIRRGLASAAREPVRRELMGALPSGEAWELAVSLLLVALGLLVGWGVARWRPHLGEAGAAGVESRAGVAADWLGLPALARVTVARPTLVFASLLARFDDAVVDGGVRLLAALGTRLAAVGRRGVEVVFDGGPEGLSRLVGRAAAGARRLQTGLSHHYYRLMVVGLAIILAVLILGG